jgi:hypothetical protein
MIANQYYGDEISDEQYYVYDLISKRMEICKNNNLIKNIIDPNSFMVRFYDFSGKYLFLNGYILDSNYNIFSKINEIYADIYGLVITNGEIKQLIIKSNLDLENPQDKKSTRNSVLIPFVPNPFREKAMYEIYENKTLAVSDLEQFDSFDLRILRNMIFAKHNYAFKDKFLQAYFNLYRFYTGNHDKNRLTDVNHLLTPEDKKNLELIQEVSKKKK